MTIRKNNCSNGVVTFDGENIFFNNEIVEKFSNVVEYIAEKMKKEKLIISFYRNGMVYFKQVNRTDFLKNPSAFLYFNGNNSSFEFCFRFQSKHSDFLLSLPNALDKNGQELNISEMDFCGRYNHLIIDRQTTKYGFIAEYHISGNIEDLRERPKKHDVYTKYVTASGKVSKCKACFEVKTSYAGAKGTGFIAYSVEKGIVAMSSGYKKSNALFRVEI